MHITEIVLPVKELHAKAKEYGVSITILITAMFLCSIHEEIPKSRQNRPIALMVPVNLRNYFPSWMEQRNMAVIRMVMETPYSFAFA